MTVLLVLLLLGFVWLWNRVSQLEVEVGLLRRDVERTASGTARGLPAPGSMSHALSEITQRREQTGRTPDMGRTPNTGRMHEPPPAGEVTRPTYGPPAPRPPADRGPRAAATFPEQPTAKAATGTGAVSPDPAGLVTPGSIPQDRDQQSELAVVQVLTWVGALTIVVGVGFFYRFAVEAGWVTPLSRTIGDRKSVV